MNAMVEQDGMTQTTPDITTDVVEPVGADEAPEAEVAYQSMEELLEQEVGLRELQAGDIVSGTVERIDDHGALVNVGSKSEGLIPPDELGRAAAATLSVGDEITVYVVDNGARDGNIILSKKKADYEKAWTDIIKAFEQNDTVTAMVIDRVKGGLVVDLGMRGFLPASHVATKNVHALDRFVGQSIRLKVIEVDRKRKRVVVSQKHVVEEERKVRRDQTVGSLEEGQIRRGVVRRVTDYGAFVDLGGIDGLLHVTEMSWGRVNHPSDIVKPGQKIDVMVLRYDPDNEKISLGLKQILPDPWQHIDQFYAVGDEVDGTVTRIVPFGAFVALDHGIEGIIPTPEMADHHIKKPGDVVETHQKIRVRIVNIRAAERRMTLSLRQVAPSHEEGAEISTYGGNRGPSSSMTIGEMLGDVFAAAEDEPVAAEEFDGTEEVTEDVVDATGEEAPVVEADAPEADDEAPAAEAEVPEAEAGVAEADAEAPEADAEAPADEPVAESDDTPSA